MKTTRLLSFALLCCGVLTAQMYAQTPSAKHQTPNVVTDAATIEQATHAVAAIHGAAGPFAVAGYRIGLRAMDELGLPKGGFAVDVLHEAPAEVQWSCVVDGLQAATGASLGKLNLHLNLATKDQVLSIVTDRESGKRIVFRLKDSFLQRFFNAPVPDLEAAGREALKLKDNDIFVMEIVNEGTRKNPFKQRKQANMTPAPKP